MRACLPTHVPFIFIQYTLVIESKFFGRWAFYMHVYSGHLILKFHFHSHLTSLRGVLNNLEIILWATGQINILQWKTSEEVLIRQK